MANVILGDTATPLTTTNHLPSAQLETMKTNTIALDISDTDTTCKKMRLTPCKEVEMVDEIIHT